MIIQSDHLQLHKDDEQTGSPKGGGRMRMLGGDSTGEATGSAAADRVRNALREAACPAEEAPS